MPLMGRGGVDKGRQQPGSMTGSRRYSLALPWRRQGLEKAKKEEYDAVIVDTAGRLQIDERLMEELREVRGLGWVRWWGWGSRDGCRLTSEPK